MGWGCAGVGLVWGGRGLWGGACVRGRGLHGRGLQGMGLRKLPVSGVDTQEKLGVMRWS